MWPGCIRRLAQIIHYVAHCGPEPVSFESAGRLISRVGTKLRAGIHLKEVQERLGIPAFKSR